MSPGPRMWPLASTWSPRVPPAEMDAGQVLQQVPRGPHDPVPGGPLGYRNILFAGSPSPALLRSIRWGLVHRPWDIALLLVLCLCLCVCLPLTWVRETSSGMFHPVLPTGQEPSWGAANKRDIRQVEGGDRPQGCSSGNRVWEPSTLQPRAALKAPRLGGNRLVVCAPGSMENVPGTWTAAFRGLLALSGRRVFLPRSASRDHLGRRGSLL